MRACCDLFSVNVVNKELRFLVYTEEDYSRKVKGRERYIVSRVQARLTRLHQINTASELSYFPLRLTNANLTLKLLSSSRPYLKKWNEQAAICSFHLKIMVVEKSTSLCKSQYQT